MLMTIAPPCNCKECADGKYRARRLEPGEIVRKRETGYHPHSYSPLSSTLTFHYIAKTDLS